MDELLRTLESRFSAHPNRHSGLEWAVVKARLEAHPEAVQTLGEMERTGGEPDVVGVESGAVVFVDCCAESPSGRRSLCYDRPALDGRKENKPVGSAVELAASWGARLLTEAEYRDLQTLGAFDLKTSSWIETPVEIRKLGGAVFGDRRYNRVFVYHNGAESYYAARGFRARVVV